MSRTNRCKGRTPPDCYFISREEYASYTDPENICRYRGYRWMRLVKPTFEETRKAELSCYHTDAGLFHYEMGNAPKHFRKTLVRRRRSREVQDLTFSVRKDWGESYLARYPHNLKDANWNWW
jgi:hypothetical protein